jgi:hypothetical protein
MKAGIDLKLRVNVKATVMKGDKVVRDYPMQHNLILDSGMEALATQFTSDMFVTACVGNGITPTERSVGSVSATGGTATSAGAFLASDVGKMLYFPSAGIQTKITGFTSTNEVSIADTTVIGAEVATIYNVDQTQLASYVVGTDTYRVTLGNVDSGADDVINDGVDWQITRWRTFQFPTETGSITYTEGGWTWEDVAVTNPTLFGRIVFATPIQVDLGEFLLLYVELNTWIDCTVKAIDPLPIENLAVAAQSTVRPTASYNRYDKIFFSGLSDHSDITTYSGGIAEPTIGQGAPVQQEDAVLIYITDDTTAITSDPQVMSNNTYAIAYVAPNAYVPNSYQKVFDAFFTGPSVDLTGTWRDIQFSGTNVNGRHVFRIKFDATQSKTPEQVVRLIFTKSWSRDLS